MKELVSSLSQAAANRLKSPLVGTLILSWIAVNHNYVAKLLFSPDETRLQLLDNAKFSWGSDFFYPITLTIVYLFVVPFVQWGIDVIKYRYLDKYRIQSQHKQLKEKYQSLAEVSEEESKSSLEYWQELHRNDAVNHGTRIAALTEQISQLKNEVKTSENNYYKLEKSNQIQHEQLGEERNTITKLKSKIEAESSAKLKATQSCIDAYHLISKLNTIPDIYLDESKHLDSIANEFNKELIKLQDQLELHISPELLSLTLDIQKKLNNTHYEFSKNHSNNVSNTKQIISNLRIVLSPYVDEQVELDEKTGELTEVKSKPTNDNV